MGPFTVDYTVSWPTGSEAKQATFSKPGNHQINLDVPSAVAATGGSFTVTFTNLKDINGCTAKTSDQSASFEVKTTRASLVHPCRSVMLMSLITTAHRQIRRYQYRTYNTGSGRCLCACRH